MNKLLKSSHDVLSKVRLYIPSSVSSSTSSLSFINNHHNDTVNRVGINTIQQRQYIINSNGVQLSNGIVISNQLLLQQYSQQQKRYYSDQRLMTYQQDRLFEDLARFIVATHSPHYVVPNTIAYKYQSNDNGEEINESGDQDVNNTVSSLSSLTTQQLYDYLDNEFTYNDFITERFLYTIKGSPDYQDEKVMMNVMTWAFARECRNINILNYFLAYTRARRQRDFNKVLHKIRQTAQLNLDTYNIILGFDGDHGNYKESTSILKEIENNGFTPNLVTKIEQLRCFIPRRSAVDRALRQLLSHTNRDESVNALIIHLLLSVQRDVPSALRIYSEIKKDIGVPSSATFHSLLVGLSTPGVERYTLIRQFWKEMINLGVSPDQETISTIIRNSSTQNQVNVAIDFFRFILKQSPEVGTSSHVLGSLLQALFLGKRYTLIEELLDHLEKKKLYTLDVYNCIISVYCKNNDQNVSEKLYHKLIQYYKPNISTFEPLIRLAIFNNNVEGCVKWQREMILNQVTPSRYLLGILMHFYLIRGNFKMTHRLKGMARTNWLYSPSIFASLLVYLEKLDKTSHQLINLQKRIQKTNEVCVKETISLTIKSYLVIGDIKSAKRWMDQYWQWGTPDDNIFYNFMAYYEIQGDMGEAIRWKKQFLSSSEVEFDPQRYDNVRYKLQKLQLISGNFTVETQFDPLSDLLINQPDEDEEEEMAEPEPIVDIKARQTNEFVLPSSFQSTKQININEVKENTTTQQSQQQQEQKVEKKESLADLIKKLEEKQKEIDRQQITENMYNKNNPKKSTLKSIITESPYLFRMRLQLLIDSDKFPQAIREFTIKENNNEEIDITSYILMIKSFIKLKDPLNLKSYFIKMLKVSGNHSISTSVIYETLNEIYTCGKAHYDPFIQDFPEELKPEGFDNVVLAITLKNDVVKGINQLSKHPHCAELCDSYSIINALLHGLILRDEYKLSAVLLSAVLDRKGWVPAYEVVSLYFSKILQQQQPIPEVTFKLFERYQDNNDLAPIALFNCVLKYLYNINDYPTAFDQFQKAHLIPKYINEQTISLAVRIYSKIYPIPPESNLTNWMFLKGGKQASRTYFYAEYFKVLIEIGRPDIVYKTVDTNPNFFNSSVTCDMCVDILNSCPTPADVIKQAIIIYKYANSRINHQVMDIILKANETVNHPMINNWKPIPAPKITQPNLPTLPPRVKQFIFDSFIPTNSKLKTEYQ